MSADAVGGLVLGAIMLSLGALLVVLARRMQAGRLPRNYLVGIRTPLTMRSDEAWRIGHCAGAPAMLGAGAAAIAGGLGALGAGLVGAPGMIPAGLAVLACGAVFAAALWSWRQAARAIRSAGLDH